MNRRAAPMQIYMKSTLPFYGIAAPLRRRRRRSARPPDAQRLTLGSTMRHLWRGRVAARTLRGHELTRGATRLMNLALLPLYEEMMVAARGGH
jgi:hypothetical protein